MFSFVPSAITQPFFELQTPDFAWKFVWIVQINYKSTKVQKVQKSTKKYISTKVLITQSFLELQTPDFAWKFIYTVQPNKKVQKYKKYRKIKKCKKHKTYKKMNLKFGRRTSLLLFIFFEQKKNIEQKNICQKKSRNSQYAQF